MLKRTINVYIAVMSFLSSTSVVYAHGDVPDEHMEIAQSSSNTELFVVGAVATTLVIAYLVFVFWRKK